MEKRFHSNQSNRDLAIQIGRCNVPTIIRGLSFITRLINNYALLLHETMDLATQRYYTLINTGRSILFATTFTQFYFLSAQIVSSAIFDSQEMEWWNTAYLRRGISSKRGWKILITWKVLESAASFPATRVISVARCQISASPSLPVWWSLLCNDRWSEILPREEKIENEKSKYFSFLEFCKETIFLDRYYRINNLKRLILSWKEKQGRMILEI